MDRGLPDDIWDDCLATIVRGRRAWAGARELEATFGAGRLAQLEAGEWIERWHVDRRGDPLEEPAWTLHPFGAARLGVVIDERSEPSGAEVPWWVGPHRRSVDVVQPRADRTVPLRCPELVADPAPDPADLFDGGVFAGGEAYLADLFDGGVTRDEAGAARLLGVPVELDIRLARASARDRRRTRRGEGKSTQGR